MIWEQQEKRMLVSDNGTNWTARFVLFTRGSQALAVHVGQEESCKSGKGFGTSLWKFHKPIPEKSALEQEIEKTKEQLKRLQERLEAEK